MDVPAFPVCEIRPEDCHRQWDSFRLGLLNSTVDTLDELLEDYTPEEKATYGCGHHLICQPTIPWSIDAWLKQRKYEWARNSFSSCPQPFEQCAAEYTYFKNETLIDYVPSGERMKGCDVGAERFVLIAFETQSRASSNGSKYWQGDVSIIGL